MYNNTAYMLGRRKTKRNQMAFATCVLQVCKRETAQCDRPQSWLLVGILHDYSVQKGAVHAEFGTPSCLVFCFFASWNVCQVVGTHWNHTTAYNSVVFRMPLRRSEASEASSVQLSATWMWWSCWIGKRFSGWMAHMHSFVIPGKCIEQ